MTLIEILSILFIHWFADFVMQDEEWAITKSKSNKALTKHVLSYSTIWFLLCNGYSVFTGNYMILALFAPITFICHWITDYFTSRLNSYLYNKKKFGSAIPNLGFFTSIGFDQWLHYAQLFITYYLLKS